MEHCVRLPGALTPYPCCAGWQVDCTRGGSYNSDGCNGGTLDDPFIYAAR